MLWVHGRSDTHDALVRVDLHDGPAAPSEGHAVDDGPGRFQGPYLLYRPEIDHFYTRYSDLRALVRCRFLTGTSTRLLPREFSTITIGLVAKSYWRLVVYVHTVGVSTSPSVVLDVARCLNGLDWSTSISVWES